MEAGPRKLAGLLVRRLREAGQEVGERVSVAELHRVLIPYHECRDRLGYATKAEYDLALLRLLRDEEVVRVEEDRLTAAVERELDSPEPGLAFLRNFAAAQLSIRPAAGEGEADIGRETETAEAEAPSAERPTGGDGTEADGEDVAPRERSARRERSAGGSLDWLETLDATDEGEASTAPPEEPCWRCGEDLPGREGLRYCPFCGTDQTERRCLSCGEELDLAWQFCPRCGTEVRIPGAAGPAGGSA